LSSQRALGENVLKKFVFASIIIILFLGTFQISLIAASNETTSIQAANSSINQAFSSVLTAEHTGGNVTGLLIRLNNAGALLSEAENSYQSGNLANVTSKADNAALIASQVNIDANALTTNSLRASRNQFALTVMFSIVTISVLVISLLLVWQRFKRAYHKKLLSSRPEVVDNQS